MQTIRQVVLPIAISVFLASCGSDSIPPPISQAQKSAIISDLQSANYPEPKQVEVNKETGFIVAVFEVVPSQIPDGGREFATDALLRIREKLLPTGKYGNFRVTLNAPSGRHTGIIERYGSARFTGGEVVWQQGK